MKSPEVDLIPAEQLKVETWPPMAAGGQHAGISYGVKVTHIDSGLIAICTSGRSQHRNRRIAVRMIEAALTDPEFRY